MSLVVSLPLPDKRLSPNARVHWARKREAVEAARMLAFAETRNAYVRDQTVLGPALRLAISLTFTLPDNRRRDLDNLIAGCKAYFDGVADALVVDDSRFDIVKLTRVVVKGESGVKIEVSA